VTELFQVLALMAVPVIYFATIRAIIVCQNRVDRVTEMSSPR
jgi:hypothetical protein